MLKRDFYNNHVDKEFTKYVETNNEGEMQEFQKYCQYYNNLGSLSMLQFELEEGQSTPILNTKRTMYLLYLLLWPMKIRYSWALFLLAAFLSFLERNNILSDVKQSQVKNKGINIFHTLLEEETLNVFLMVFLIPSGSILRTLIHLSLSLWALMHVCEMLAAQLRANPDTPVISILKPQIDQVIVSKVEINKAKNHVELFVGVICLPLVFMQYCALIFPIIYFQYIRIKYVSNLYTKHSFVAFEESVLNQVLPQALRDTAAFLSLKNFFMSFFQFEGDKSGDKKNAEGKENDFSATQRDTPRG
mmetsp:Transcript_15430/g.26105  ORF Transcript_15430/g.26105 Transcript_15430/m.26105 type:complete len:303 (+) Transcript_15430:248-1156(+)